MNESIGGLFLLKTIGAACERIDPTPALSLVAVPALVMSREERATLESAAPDITFSGWVDYQIANSTMPDGPAPKRLHRAGVSGVRRLAIHAKNCKREGPGDGKNNPGPCFFIW